MPQPTVLDEVFALAATALPAAGVQCLVVGGFAVNHYGYTRNTLDVDFMIAADQIAAVRPIMEKAGFTSFSISDTVAFFAKPGSTLRVDFLRVDAATMRTLSADTGPIMLSGHSLRVPSLKNLLAMKLFAMANAPARRLDKDLPDVAYLCVLNDLSLEDDLLPLCRRYASDGIYRLVQQKVESLRT